MDDDGAGGGGHEGEVDEDFFGEGGGGEGGDFRHGLVQVEQGGPAVGLGGLEGVLDFRVWVFGRFEEFGGTPVFDEDFELFGLGYDVDGVGFGFAHSADEVGDSADEGEESAGTAHERIDLHAWCEIVGRGPEVDVGFIAVFFDGGQSGDHIHVDPGIAKKLQTEQVFRVEQSLAVLGKRLVDQDFRPSKVFNAGRDMNIPGLGEGQD